MKGEKKVIETADLKGFAKYLKRPDVKKVVFLVGAGISTAAGIPDFRSPKTGLYHNLARLKLPYAEAVFDIDYFRERPEAFYTLAGELYPGKFEPTKFHKLMKLTQDQGKLLRVYTQNIDTLERIAGIDDKYIVEAHGSFAVSRCIDCKVEADNEAVKLHVQKSTIPRCSECKGLVKPDIVFFGENLPKKFFQMYESDMKDADAAIIAGSSLTVHPFAGLADMVSCPRLLVNLEKAGSVGRNTNDIVQLDYCDKVAIELAKLLEWQLEADEVDEAESQSDGASSESDQDYMSDELIDEIKKLEISDKEKATKKAEKI
ncbi:hypothetical protein CANCADRAFT_31058 [Tortispora caseinolytica NRRL Y-17796]|uniref:NAD-dependent protein deacetylase n=1 Tax=Tortispora caseinolytica NRRL Y-17796 TaxID=767744 RepID=A0A1E4TDX1_9ASCO|nr:hypothetical protein CANCADRAFT_31058 [Tortispora caseinolytica NRRL Y-17796]